MSIAAYAQEVVSFLSVLTVIGQILAVALAAGVITGMLPGIRAFVSRHILVLLLIAPLLGLLGSLYFSEIAGWTPCRLCWFQRIFLYPQVFILLLAMYRRDKNIIPYILLLSAIGIMISGWHYGEQVWAATHPLETLEPCDDTGVSCASTPFFHFGYITIPMMALTAFLLNIVGSAIALRRS
jgi:disulfide bond formation protein DsbB